MLHWQIPLCIWANPFLGLQLSESSDWSRLCINTSPQLSSSWHPYCWDSTDYICMNRTSSKLLLLLFHWLLHIYMYDHRHPVFCTDLMAQCVLYAVRYAGLHLDWRGQWLCTRTVFLMQIQSTLLRFWLLCVMSVIVLVNQLPAFRATWGYMRGYLMRNIKLEIAIICGDAAIIIYIYIYFVEHNRLSSTMGFLTILLMNKLNVWFKMLTNKINTVLLYPVNKHISNIFTVTKCTTIINQMKKYWKHWFIETYSSLILIKR